MLSTTGLIITSISAIPAYLLNIAISTKMSMMAMTMATMIMVAMTMAVNYRFICTLTKTLICTALRLSLSGKSAHRID